MMMVKNYQEVNSRWSLNLLVTRVRTSLKYINKVTINKPMRLIPLVPDQQFILGDRGLKNLFDAVEDRSFQPLCSK